MSEEENAQLSGPETTAADDAGNKNSDGKFRKSGFIILFGIIAGNYVGGMVAGSGALSGIGMRVLFILAIVLTLDHVLGVSRQWIPPALK